MLQKTDGPAKPARRSILPSTLDPQPCLTGTRPTGFGSIHAPMPIKKQLYEEMQIKRAAEHDAAERERRWSLIGSGLLCLMWAALGLFCYAFAFHTTDPEWGEIFKWGAFLITYGGVSYTLLRAYRKGEQRGDW